MTILIQWELLPPLTGDLFPILISIFSIGIFYIIFIDIGIVAVVIHQFDQIAVRIIYRQPCFKSIIRIGIRQKDRQPRIIGSDLWIQISLLYKSQNITNTRIARYR